MKKYDDDHVSLSTAIFMAQAAYLKACVIERTNLGQKKGTNLELCREKAKKHVKDDILFVLDQDGKKPLKNN